MTSGSLDDAQLPELGGDQEARVARRVAELFDSDAQFRAIKTHIGPESDLVCRKLAETARFLEPGTLVTQDLMSHIDFRFQIRLGPTRAPEDRRSTATAAGSRYNSR